MSNLEIHIPQVGISEKEILKKDLGQKITFFPKHILFEAEGIFDVEDEKLGMMSERHYKNKAVIHRDCEMEMFLSVVSEKFILKVDRILIGFNSENDCIKLFDKIVKWKFYYAD